MTAKRFTILYGIDENPFEWDIMDNNNDALICRCNGKPICDLLNELAEENEQLKTTIQQLRTDNTKQKKKLNTAMKENEHIKQTIKDMINTERTEIGQSVLRQLWEAIQ